MKNQELIQIIESTLDEDILKTLKEALVQPEADRGIYETWGGRAKTAYDTIKKIYILLQKDSTSKYINGELGVIAIDNNGRPVYEDIVHDMGNGRFRYYIQPSVPYWSTQKLIIPEREDIPKENWGKEVNARWIEFSREKIEIKQDDRVSYPKDKPDGYTYIVREIEDVAIIIERMTADPNMRDRLLVNVAEVQLLPIYKTS